MRSARLFSLVCLTLLVASTSVIAVQYATFEADDEGQPITAGEEVSSVPLTNDN